MAAVTSALYRTEKMSQKFREQKKRLIRIFSEIKPEKRQQDLCSDLILE